MIALKPGDVFLESGLSLASPRRSPSCTGSAASRAATVEVHRRRRPTRERRTRARSGRRSPSPKGPRTVVGTVRITGQRRRCPKRELRPLIKLAEGQPFYQPQVSADRDALIVEYLNNGFSSADVVVDAGVLERPARAST